MKDNDIPFGQTADQIIMEHVKEFNFPVCFNFPAGHITDNRALVFGRQVNMIVEEENVRLTYAESQF